MSAFQSPVDIANRALQHCGSPRITDFTEDSKQASETAFVYDMLRQAELRRNVWRFSTRRACLRPIDPTFILVQPTLWSSSTTYALGALVTDSTGVIWMSLVPDNLNQAPGGSTNGYWDVYFGPLAVPPWDTTGSTAYYSGELVYIAAGNGTASIYMSLLDGNSDDPQTPSAYSSTTTYMHDQVTQYNNVSYRSLIDLNLNNEPDLSPASWVSTTTYSSGQQVCGSNGEVYTSAVNNNTGNDPTLDNGSNWTATGNLCPWTTTLLDADTGSYNWRLINASWTNLLALIYPVGAGPTTQTFTKNVFRLPAGYLRKASQDPKAGSRSYLGAPSGNEYDDWEFEGDYITSRTAYPIVLRFVADITDVTKMDPMFCEGLAARIALEVCESLTQSDAKMKSIGGMYTKFMTEARMVNGIETGADEPPEDEFISCRL